MSTAQNYFLVVSVLDMVAGSWKFENNWIISISDAGHPVLRRQREMDLYKLEASLVYRASQGYTGRPCFKKKTKQKNYNKKNLTNIRINKQNF